jgi:hypothetical protein
MAAIAVRELGRHEGSPLRKAFVVMVTSAAGMALLSCSALQPSAVRSSTSSTVYEPSAPIARAPLSAPVGYASPSSPLNAQTTSPPYASPYHATAGDGKCRDVARFSTLGRGKGRRLHRG